MHNVYNECASKSFKLYFFYFFRDLYAVVLFTKSDTVEMVPTNWLVPSRGSCMWPGHVINIRKVVQERLPPQSSWKEYSVRLLYSTGKSDLNFLLVSQSLALLFQEFMDCRGILLYQYTYIHKGGYQLVNYCLISYFLFNSSRCLKIFFLYIFIYQYINFAYLYFFKHSQ